MPTLRPRVVGFIFLVATAILGSGCRDDTAIRVFAASSLQDVLPAILDSYAETDDGVTFEVQYGGSQALATQIELGAEADLFLSANPQQVERLTTQDLVSAQRPLVTNSLVVVLRSGAPIETFADLGRPGLRIAIGAPEVPVGALTQRLLAALDPALAAAIRANVVTEDPNVRVALSRVDLGEADAAFVYRTDAATVSDLAILDLPVAVAPNQYVGAVLRDADPDAAVLLDFIAGPVAAPIWRSAGFAVPGTP
ncbi:MAG: molybdate ABC transporter substrate-binding protein [Chloroflexi bacterium]|nr:molybdate ABC transporter substrate-binding protein [Chloroflexota bacterium]